MSEIVESVGTGKYREKPPTGSGEPQEYKVLRTGDNITPGDLLDVTVSPDPSDSTPVAASGGQSYGPGSLGPAVDGWHPQGE